MLDGIGALVFLTGVALVGRAWLGFREVQSFQPGPGGPPMEAVTFADRFWLMQKVGVTVMIIGVGVFVGAWWIARRRSRAS